VQKVSENQKAALQDYQQAQANLAALGHSAETDLAALGEKEKQLKFLAAGSDKKLLQGKKVLARLTADQRKQLAEAEKKATAKANAEGRPRRSRQQKPMRTAGLRGRPRPQHAAQAPVVAKQPRLWPTQRLSSVSWLREIFWPV
jgi:hypothetical protein